MEGINSRRFGELGERIPFYWKRSIKGISFKLFLILETIMLRATILMEIPIELLLLNASRL